MRAFYLFEINFSKYQLSTFANIRKLVLHGMSSLSVTFELDPSARPIKILLVDHSDFEAFQSYAIPNNARLQKNRKFYNWNG